MQLLAMHIDERPLKKMEATQHMEQFKIFSGTSNRPLAQAICNFLNVEIGKAEISRFKSGEIYVRYRTIHPQQ